MYRTLEQDKEHSIKHGYESVFYECFYKGDGIAAPNADKALSMDNDFSGYDVLAERLGESVVAIDFDLRLGNIVSEGKQEGMKVQLRSFQKETDNGHGGVELIIDLDKCFETLPDLVKRMVEQTDSKITYKGIQCKIKTPPLFANKQGIILNDYWAIDTCPGFWQGKQCRPVFMSGSRKLKGLTVTHRSINDFPAISMEDLR